MYYVYVLKSLKDESRYIGYADDLKERFKKHQEGKVKSTRPHRPYEIIYYEAYKDKRDAIKQEQVLKTGQGRRILKRKLEYSK